VEHTVLVIELDSSRSKQIISLLTAAGYDALVVSRVDEVMRKFYQVSPDAVIVSQRLSASAFEHVCDSISAMSDLPLIELTDQAPLAPAPEWLTASTQLPDIVKTLERVLGTTNTNGRPVGCEKSNRVSEDI